eukprot:5189798-Prymnesium_polylepis.1
MIGSSPCADQPAHRRHAHSRASKEHWLTRAGGGPLASGLSLARSDGTGTHIHIPGPPAQHRSPARLCEH